MDFDVELGYSFANHGAGQSLIGLVVGRKLDERLELDAEFYNQGSTDPGLRSSILDIGGRFKFSPSFIALLMAGRSIRGFGPGQPEFTGYFGLQILLSDYGRHLNTIAD